MTADELQTERRRRGYWLRLARNMAGPNGSPLNQSVAAKAIGLSERSGSAISDMERGDRDVTATELTRLSRLYGVPREIFDTPRESDEEWLRAIRDRHETADLTDEEAALVAGIGVGVGRAARLARQPQPGDEPSLDEDTQDRTGNQGAA